MNFFDYITQLALAWAMDYQNFAITFLAIVGFFRMFFKPLTSLITTYIKFTPNVVDDEIWGQITNSTTYKMFVYFIDWLLSIKLPKK
jgi:hypothetical protein